MKKTAFVLLGIVISVATCRGQSVAQTLVTLTTKVGDLEKRPVSGGGTGSPLVESSIQDGGGKLRILDSAKQGKVGLATDKDGGIIAIANKTGVEVVKAVTNTDQGGTVFLFNQTGSKRVVELGIGANTITGGLWLYDKEGTKVLASFGTTKDGTSGVVTVNGTNVHDYAEVFDVADCRGLKPGSVVAASADGKGIQLSSRAYDSAAMGVLSGAGRFQSGMRIGSREDGSTDLPIAVAGQVYVRVNGEAGPIQVGDLLVSSSVPGVAMRGADGGRLTGTVIGKALQPYAQPPKGTEETLIRMLVLNR